MPFDSAPTNVISGWSENGTDVTFPLASVAELTAEEADAVSGDSRKIIYALMEQIHNWHNGLDSADKPEKLNVSRNEFLSGSNRRRVYTIDITVGGNLDVVDES